MSTTEKDKVVEKAAGRSFWQSVVSIINGSYFSRDEVMKILPFVLFLVGLTLVYIGNGYYAEGTVRRINKAETDLKELRSEYIATKSELMHKSKQSEVAHMLSERNSLVKESLVPPHKIVAGKPDGE